MTGLASLLATEPLAHRRSAGADVWDVPSSGWQRRDGERLLGRAIERLLAEGPACFLVADPATDLVDLGAGAWELLGDRSWRVPAQLNVARFLESEVHSQGNYLIYASPAPVSARALGACRWWGPRREAEPIVRGLGELGVIAAIAVHPDASDWLAAVASGPPAQDEA